VTKWLFDLEMLIGKQETMDDVEQAILDRVHEMLPAAGVKLTPGRHCLAAELASLWAGFYDDTWVWGGKRRIPPAPSTSLSPSLASRIHPVVQSLPMSHSMSMLCCTGAKYGLADMSNDSNPSDWLGTQGA